MDTYTYQGNIFFMCVWRKRKHTSVIFSQVGKNNRCVFGLLQLKIIHLRAYTKAYGYRIAGIFYKMSEGVWGLRKSQDCRSSVQKIVVVCAAMRRTCSAIFAVSVLGVAISLFVPFTAFSLKRGRTMEKKQLVWL